jgi:hypothetical protein
MTLADAQRWTEVLLALALIQQSAEHWFATPDTRFLSSLRIALSVLLIAGFDARVVEIGLLIVGAFTLYRYQGPYNGGSDRMGYLILVCVCASRWAPSLKWQEIAMGYLALQLTLSYAISGWVKIINRDWRTGQALADVFLFSAYPVSKRLRALHTKATLLGFASWAVMLLELLFPFALVNRYALYVALTLTMLFHLANAFCFGLNRFVWVWLAAYPALLWFQQRIFS